MKKPKGHRVVAFNYLDRDETEITSDKIRFYTADGECFEVQLTEDGRLEVRGISESGRESLVVMPIVSNVVHVGKFDPWANRRKAEVGREDEA